MPGKNQTNCKIDTRRLLQLAVAVFVCAAACSRPAEAPPAPRPSILLVTLDTTRADAIGPEAAGVDTPAFNALAARGQRFRHAYAPAPETLPSHSSILTGLYPGGHGVHENARHLSAAHPLLAEELQRAGYRTAAFVSSFVLARRYGLARGFDTYDDDLPADRVERSARETTDRALAYLRQPSSGQPTLMWVHYFEPHTPYAPAEPFRSRYPKSPYLAEVAAMDEELGRLVDAFERSVTGPVALAVVGDHGEGLGDHGELQHGHLLYQSTMRVPLVLAGPGVTTGVADEPVSIRRIFHTLRDWAGLDRTDSLLRPSATPEVVLGEAMKPFLNYGWQPQVMAVEGRQKAILAGRLEIYDVVADPGETRDVSADATLSRPVSPALRDYPVPSADATRDTGPMSSEDQRKLASLGYVSAGAAPVVRKDAPRPVDMTHLFEVIEKASSLFVAARYAEVVPLLRRIVAADPFNLDATLRLATAHSALGQNSAALDAFKKAAAIAPRSQDVRLYLALHYAKGADWSLAAPLLEEVVADSPERLPALEGLASIRVKQGRADDAIALWQRVHALRAPAAGELIQVGQMAMSLQRTDVALAAFEKARNQLAASFKHDLELGVLYMAARRYDEARQALDRVPAQHPDYPMALFKRAQASVLLNEPDRARRIQLAREKADATTRPLIESERLFSGVGR